MKISVAHIVSWFKGKDNSFYSRGGKVFHLHNDKECSEDLGPFLQQSLSFDNSFCLSTEDIKYWPAISPDIIFLSNERDGSLTIKDLRKRFPHSMFIGLTKEPLELLWRENLSLIKENLSSCDIVGCPYFYQIKEDYQNLLGTGIDLQTIIQPFNPRPFKSKYLSEKSQDIKMFFYRHWDNSRSGSDVFTHLYSKFNKDIKCTTGTSDNFNEFIKLWKDSHILINLDPTGNYGKQSIECATLNTTHLGSRNDAAQVLWQDLASIDLDFIESKIMDFLNNPQLLTDYNNYAHNKLIEVYSVDSFKSTIFDLYKN